MSKYIYRLIIIFSLSAVCGWSKATTWIPLTLQKSDKAIITEIIKSDQTGYKVKVVINGLSDDLLNIGSEEFHKLSFDSESYFSKIGEPSLPLFTQSIAIPKGAKIAASISEEQWTDIEIGKIYPTQMPLLETERATSFNLIEKAYRNSYIPTLLSMGKEMVWRNIRNVDIAVCPFRYYPEENRLSVMNEFILVVSFTYDSRRFADSNVEPEDPLSLFDNIPYIEPNQVQRRYDSQTRLNRNANDYNYLIIVGNITGILCCDKMKEFQKWKAFKGFKTKVVPTDTTGTTPSQIKNYIAQEYNKGVRYVLFVGDNDKIPLADVFTARNRYVLSDYWYGCLNGDNDLQAEIPVGRFPVTSLDDFNHMVDKTIKYERLYNSSNKVLLVAHEEGAEPYYTEGFQSCCEQIKDAHEENASFVLAYGSAIYGNNATNAFVVSNINQGAHIVNYRGHGAPMFWGGPNGYTHWNGSLESFTINEINNMNDTTCAVFFAIACQTGSIEEQICMLEAFTRSNHGAVAYIGSTEDTNHNVNNGYDKLLFSKLITNNVFHIGELNISAHISNNLTSSNENKDNPFCYICGGDPTLELWTANPQKISANVSVSNGILTVNSGLPGNYYISVVSEDGERIDSIPCSSSTCSFSIPASKFYFVINKHNYFPKIIYYDSVTSNIVNMRFDYDAYYTATPISMDSDATTYDEDEGNIVRSGSKLVIYKGSGGVTVVKDFECEKGAEFEIRSPN